MSIPNEKDKNRQGSSGRPGTKFLEKPGTESDAAKEDQFGDEGVLDQQEKPEGEEPKKEDSWKYANPNPNDPGKKAGQDKSGQKDKGNDKGGEQGMGKEE